MPLIRTLLVKPGYRPQSQDTSSEFDVFYFDALRQKTQEWRIERFISFNQSTRKLCLTAIKNQHSDLPIRSEYIRRRLGQAGCNLEMPGQAREVIHDSGREGDVVVADPITFAKKVVRLLEGFNIAYYIGGSVASSLFGESRYTEDLNLIIAIDKVKARLLLEAFLEAHFYISDIAVEDAGSGRCSSFNILDNETLEKADLFISQNTPFAQSKMERRVQYPLPDGSSLWIAAPEDIVLQKLVWGRDSQSEKQWRDVLGVLKLQGDRLNFEYLWHWSNQLGIAETLDQAFREAGL